MITSHTQRASTWRWWIMNQSCKSRCWNSITHIKRYTQLKSQIIIIAIVVSVKPQLFLYAPNCTVNPINSHGVVIVLVCCNCVRVAHITPILSICFEFMYFLLRFFFVHSTHGYHRVFNYSFSFRTHRQKAYTTSWYCTSSVFLYVAVFPCNLRERFTSKFQFLQLPYEDVYKMRCARKMRCNWRNEYEKIGDFAQ